MVKAEKAVKELNEKRNDLALMKESFNKRMREMTMKEKALAMKKLTFCGKQKVRSKREQLELSDA